MDIGRKWTDWQETGQINNNNETHSRFLPSVVGILPGRLKLLKIIYSKETTKKLFFCRFSSTVRLDDTRGLFVVGGSDYVPGFTGYIGKLTYYRNTAVEASKVGK